MSARVRRIPLRVLSGLVTAGLFMPVQAQDSVASYDRDQALAISQAAIGRQFSNYELLDTQGRAFKLGQLAGRPLVISLIFTSCHHTCPMLTTHLDNVADVAREALGEDSFSLVTIGFDTRADTPERMRMFAADRGIDRRDWHFLSGDEATIRALTEELGFIFFPSPRGFDHLAQTTVIDAEGIVYRQVYGQAFPTPALVEPLKELIFQIPADASLLEHWLNDVRLFCTIYDPGSGRYRFDYSILVSFAVGFMCLTAVATFVLRSWRDSV